MTESVAAHAIRERLIRIRETIGRAAAARGRRAEEVALLAVTKGHGLETVRNAVQAGLSLFGENRVGEGVSKIEALRAGHPSVVWRLIGPLQTNKARAALQYFHAVESLDRERLAVRLERLLEEEGRRLPVLLEINLASEPTKSGARPDQAQALAAAALACPHLDVQGLMAVPPFTAEAEGARPYFRELRALRDRLSDRFGRPFPELSIGMSHDFAVAVEEGSTEVRIGTALFGPREP
jgi:pyridoxal phosphate enzyme (YggS family)